MTEKRTIDDVLKRHIRTAENERMEWAAARVLRRLRSEPDTEDVVEPARGFAGWQRLAFGSAAMVATIVVVIAILVRPEPIAAVQAVDGSLYRADKPLRAGERIAAGENVRTEGGAGSTLSLEDGTRIEMRTKSELSFRRADDGILVNLRNGGVIINAAKQRNGHLYVETKDVAVSVAGTVFLVNTEETGSRVAVIEGEVSVKQGGTAQKLLSGEQVVTNPTMPTVPVASEILWSRHAPEHLALLQQPDSFEVASVRPTVGVEGGRGGGTSGCVGNPGIQITPRRFSVSGTTLQVLLTWAYGTGRFNYASCKNVTAVNTVSGGPGWVRTDLWDVEANIPEGAFNYTLDQLRDGDAPKLRKMIQNLLADRFKVVMKKETKEVSAYVLTAPQGEPRLTLRKEIDTPEFRQMLANMAPGITPERGVFFVKDSPIADLVPLLEQDITQPITDQTGLKGRYTFVIEYTPLSRLQSGGTLFAGPAIFTALQEQVGLKLEQTRKTMEMWVVDRAERATPNP